MMKTVIDGTVKHCAVSPFKPRAGVRFNRHIKGFTLVEVIVVALLVSILVLGAGGLFSMYLNSSRESAAFLRMHRQGDALMEEIARMARASNAIMPGIMPSFSSPESFETYLENVAIGGFVPDSIASARGARFILYDEEAQTITVMGAVMFNNGKVQICTNDPCEYNGDWNDFTIDGHPVLISAESGAESAFIFGTNRFEVAVSATIKTEIAKREYSLRIERWIFKCRIPHSHQT